MRSKNHSKALLFMLASALVAGCGGGASGFVAAPAPGTNSPGAATTAPNPGTSGATTAPKSGASPSATPGSGSPTASPTPVPGGSGALLPNGEVSTTSGIYTGTSTNGIDVFRGIPFAQPPVGTLRFKPTQPLASPRPGVNAAATFSPACEQAPSSSETVAGPQNQSAESEDCLYLNVYAPADLSGSKPVDVWIYGGSFTAGYANPYDGTPYAQNGVVFVSLNYRLGIFGFFSHPGLDAESAQHTSGNQGLFDQLQALQWVRQNISHFGGNPNNITIHGESAGALSVGQFIVSPLTKGLFQHAIEESGAGFLNEPTRVQHEQELGAAYPGFYSQSIATLRALPAQTLVAEEETANSTPGGGSSTVLNPYGFSLFEPSVDGYFLPLDDRHMWLAHRFNTVDILDGNCENEGYLFTMTDAQYETPPTFESNLTAVYTGSLTDAAVAAYPVSTPNPNGNPGFTPTDAAYQLGNFFGDPTLQYGSRETARYMSQVNPNVFRYAFTRPAPGQVGPDTHICEIPFVFPGLYPPTAQQAVPDPEAAAYSAMIVNAWSQFMKTGNPNGGTINNWPAYGENDPYLNFTASGPVPGTGFRNQALDVVDAYHQRNNP